MRGLHGAEPGIEMSAPASSSQETQKLDRSLAGGLAWTAAAKWISQLISWPSVVITTHLLSPADYGLVEMAGFYFVVTNVLAEFGIGMAVLQMRELDMEVTAQLNTVATISGCALFLISVTAAPLIAAFFNAPPLHHLVIVASISFILTSLEAIPLGLLQRDMNYRRLSIAESAQAVVMACVTVAGAYGGMGYWSLLAGNLIGRAANVGLVIIWRPVSFAWPRWKQISAPLRFGMEIAVQRIAFTINSLSDVMVIGRTMGQAPLGAYRVATNLANSPADKVGTLVMRVTGPLFSRVQTDKGLMLRYFLNFSEILAMSAFPLLFGIAIVAPEVVNLILGPQWQSAGAPLRWLAIFISFRVLSALTNQLLPPLRLTRFGMWMSVLNFVLMPIAFYIASRWGVAAVAAAWLVMSPVTLLPSLVMVLRELKCSAGSYIRALLPASVGSVAMWAAIYGMRKLTLHGWPLLIAEMAAGGAVYCAVLWGLYRERVMRFVRFVTDLRKPRTDIAPETLAAV